MTSRATDPVFVELPPAPIPDVGERRPLGDAPFDASPEGRLAQGARPAGLGVPASAAAGPAHAEGSPPPPRAYDGFFPFASTSLRGLSTPFWCLLGYLFIATTMIDEEWRAVGALRPRLILGALAILVSGWRWLSRPKTRERHSVPHAAVTGWLVAFVIVGAFAALWAFEPGVAKDAQLDAMTSMLVYFLLLAIVRTRRELAVTLLVLALGSGLYLARSFTEWMSGKYIFTMGVKRMMGAGTSISDPNSFAGTIAFSLPALLWCATRASLPPDASSRAIWARVVLRICAVVYGLLAVYCAIATHSRSGLVLLVLNVLFALVTLPSRKAKAALAVVLAGMVVWLFAGQTDEAIKRYASIANKDTYSKESSTADRVKNYGIAWRMLQDNPVLGVGPGCWSVYRTRRVDGDPLMPHSLTGQVIATYGALGTIAFVGYLGAVLVLCASTIRRLWRSKDAWDRAVRALAAAVAFTIGLLLVSGLGAHNVDRMAWYLLPGLLAAATTVREGGDPPPKKTRLAEVVS